MSLKLLFLIIQTRSSCSEFFKEKIFIPPRSSNVGSEDKTSTYNNTSLEHLGETLLHGTCSDDSAAVSVSVSICSSHYCYYCILKIILKYENFYGPFRFDRRLADRKSRSKCSQSCLHGRFISNRLSQQWFVKDSWGEKPQRDGRLNGFRPSILLLLKFPSHCLGVHPKRF